MYRLKAYGSMVADSVRMDAYTQALQTAVKPGSVVLDIGTGTGAFALLACRFGARKVYAVEPDNAIQVARELAAANGYGDAIEFLQALSTGIDLPEKADVILADLRGVTPIQPGNHTSMADAKRRFLAPGGVIFPQQDTIKAVLIQAPKLHVPLSSPWGDNHHDFDLAATRAYLSHQWFRADLGAEQMMSEAVVCGTLDYGVLDSSDFTSKVAMVAAKPGPVHGFALWFDAILLPGIGFSTAPGPSKTVYGQAFFPWPEAVELAVGDRVDLQLEARLVGDDYLWSWKSTIRGHDGAGPAKFSFRQSTFFGEPVTLESLRKGASSHVPSLNEEGEIDSSILRQMGDQVPLGEIARELASRHPSRFPGWEDALTRVGELSKKYSK